MAQKSSPMESVSFLRKTSSAFCAIIAFGLLLQASFGADFIPAPQRFHQEIAAVFGESDGLSRRMQLIECAEDGTVRAFGSGRWYVFHDGHWRPDEALAASEESRFAFPDASGKRIEALAHWLEIRQIVRFGVTNFISGVEPLMIVQDKPISLGWERSMGQVNQIAISPEGRLHVASSGGLFRRNAGRWARIAILDDGGRAWAVT